MLNEIMELQTNAVEQLLNAINSKGEIVFQAPTGSGKTFMMADFMEKILENNSDVIFLVSTLSQGGLAKQNFDKFYEYKNSGLFTKIDPYLISSEISGEESLFIPVGHNVYVLPRDIFKERAKLKRGGLVNFLHNITLRRSLGGLEKKIYLIKDESHIATKNLDGLASFFCKKINFSATPKESPDVLISESDAVRTKLIKSLVVNEVQPYGENLNEALEKFKEIKSQYEKLIPDYHPCLIIQVSSDFLHNHRGEEEIERVISKLNQHELKWMVLVQDGKTGYRDYGNKLDNLNLSKEQWKDYVKANNSPYDVVIFKMVVSTGYDIPRACMLYQLRDVQSKILQRQVIGRVRRVPHLVNFENLSEEAQELATKAYVWADILPDEKAIMVNLEQANHEIEDEIKIKTTILKSLGDKKDFDLEEIVDANDNSINSANIFDLYNDLNHCDPEIVKMCYDYADDFDKWCKFNKNLSKIKSKFNSCVCNYEESMALSLNDDGTEKVVSFAPQSSFTLTEHKTNLNNWVWSRDGQNYSFSFDSEAEKEWAEILSALSSDLNEEDKHCIASTITNHRERFLWGKNYLQNSQIRFEYYLDGRHFSYPDFVMKDSFGRVYLMEVKSINEAKNSFGLDSESYNEKILELMKCYKQASKLTNQIFVIPLKEEDAWTIYVYKDGIQTKMTKDTFKTFVRTRSN